MAIRGAGQYPVSNIFQFQEIFFFSKSFEGADIILFYKKDLNSPKMTPHS